MAWVNQIVQGIMLGGQYALFACGLSLLYGVMRIINLAHGDLAILGAFVALELSDRTKLSPFVIVFGVVAVLAAVGWALQRGIFERSLRSGELITLLSTFGLGIVIQNLLLEKFGADTQSLGSRIGTVATGSFKLTDSISISHLDAITMVVAIAMLGGLQMFLSRTSSGRAMRATASDPDTAELVGVDARRVYAAAAAIAVATAGVAGCFYAMHSTFDAYAGPSRLIFAYEVVIIGGLGSLWGTLAGGVVLGVAQAIGAKLSPQWPLLAGHLTFVAVLLVQVLMASRQGRGGWRRVLGRFT